MNYYDIVTEDSCDLNALSRYVIRGSAAEGIAMKMESKREIPTAVWAGKPMVVNRGITRMGPPAPDAAQTAPVERPRSRYRRQPFVPEIEGRSELLFTAFLRLAAASLTRIEIPDRSTTR